MPEIVVNAITFTGEAADVENLRAHAFPKGKFLMQRVLPEPQGDWIAPETAMQYLPASLRAVPEEPHTLGDFVRKQELLPVAMHYALRAWKLQHWGTSWCGNNRLLGIREEPEGTVLDAFCVTLWGPPTPVLKTLSEKHPGISILLVCANDSGDFALQWECQNGEIVRRLSLDWETCWSAFAKLQRQIEAEEVAQ